MAAQDIEPRFVICISNAGYPDDLKVRMVYQALPDDSATRSHSMRVIDETGEDYLYPAECFVPVDVPHEVESALMRTAGSS